MTLTFLHVIQVQGLLVELREGLCAAVAELADLRQRDHVLEEKLQAHQTEVDDKIMGLKNSLNTFKVQDWVKQKRVQVLFLEPQTGFCNMI